MCGRRLWTYRQEEPLRSTRFEELLPLLRILLGKGDGEDGELKLGLNGPGPGVQL